jgi:zinc protease
MTTFADGVVRSELSNGMMALVRKNPASPSVVISGYLWAGGLHEPPERSGLANTMSEMLMRGNERRDFAQINEALESVGASAGFSVGYHTLGFSGKGLAEDLPLVLEVLSDCLSNPTFPARQLEKVRGEVETSLLERENSTRAMAGLRFRELLYPGHPYGRSLLGYKDTIPAIRREDVMQFHQQVVSPNGAALAVVGDVDADEALAALEATLGGWSAAAPEAQRQVPDPAPMQEVRIRRHPMPGKSQSDLVWGVLGLRRVDPQFLPARLANTVLGVFGMMGRLGKAVRDRQGLAYYAYTALSAGWGAGPWMAMAGVNPANVQPAVDSILEEVRRLRDELVPEEELNDSKSYLTGSMPLRLETNEGMAGYLLDVERFGLGLDYLDRYPGLIDAVTAHEVREVVRQYLTLDAYALAIAGPEATS